MNAKEFKVFMDFCPYLKVEYYPSIDNDPFWFCNHSGCSTVKGTCSRIYCPLLKSIKETDKN